MAEKVQDHSNGRHDGEEDDEHGVTETAVRVDGGGWAAVDGAAVAAAGAVGRGVADVAVAVAGVVTDTCKE